jgi:hypothetical protein
MAVLGEFEYFGELEEELEEEMLGRELAPLFAGEPFLRRSGRAERFDSGGSPGPVFDIDCAGCPIRDCKPALQRAMVEAVRLAQNAATKLEAAISVERSARDKDAKKTARVFQSFFCHDPSLPIPWADNQPSGLSIAKRLRSVARELGGGRRIQFVCLPTAKACTTATCCANEIARARPGEPWVLCEEFWKESDLDDLPTVDLRAGVLIHEMLHFLFAPNLHGGGIIDRGPSRGVADCYESFVLQINDLVALRGKCKRCKGI